MHEQTERTCGVSLRQFELEVMHLRETWKLDRIETCDVPPVTLKEFRQNVAPLTVAGGPWRARIAARNDLEFGKWRRACEILIGIHVHVGRMIDRRQSHLIQIDQFFHHFGKPETETTIAQFQMPAVDTKVFCRVWRICLTGAHPVAHDPRTDHVGNELILLTVPDPYDRTRTTAPVDLPNDVAASRRELNFILHDAGRPEQPHDV